MLCRQEKGDGRPHFRLKIKRVAAHVGENFLIIRIIRAVGNKLLTSAQTSA